MLTTRPPKPSTGHIMLHLRHILSVRRTQERCYVDKQMQTTRQKLGRRVDEGITQQDEKGVEGRCRRIIIIKEESYSIPNDLCNR